MKSVRLIYCSAATERITEETLASILKTSRRNNQLRGITGMLCQSDENFIQCLEGDYFQVNKLYGEIITDSRHKNTCLLSYEETDEKLFTEFSMGHIDDPFFIGEALFRTINQEYSLSLSLLGRVSTNFMRSLANYRK